MIVFVRVLYTIRLSLSTKDNYILTNSLQVALLMSILGEGTLLPSGNVPLFTAWAFTITFGSAIVLLLLSTWLAIHASITAHSCGLSLLLQSRQVRDIPTGTEIDETRFKLQDFEERRLDEQLRVPFAKRMKQFFSKSGSKAVFERQAQPYHFQADSLENFYLNERLEESQRRAHYNSTKG